MKKKFYFRKKGFTLIELLAVIVILAIILLIAMPIVLNVISEAKKGAFESSARGLIKTAENEYMKNALSGNNETKTYVFVDYEQTGDLEFSGKGPRNGYIHVTTDGKVAAVLEDGTWLVKKELNEKDIVTEELEDQDIEEIFNGMIGEAGPALPENNDIAYANDPSEPSIPENATPCEIEGLEFTHIIDKRDENKIYPVTKIGNQCWFAENLSYTGNGCSLNAWETTTPYDACQANGGSNWDQNEVLYQWGAVMDGDGEGGQGLCPTGWHIPTHDEWTELEREICTSITCATDFPYNNTTTGYRGTDEGQKLKSKDSSWVSNTGTNTAGFHADPTGWRSGWSGNLGILYDVNAVTYFWTSTPSTTNPWFRHLHNNDNRVVRTTTHTPSYGFSVRCLLNP